MDVILPTREEALEVILAKIGYREVDERKAKAQELQPNWRTQIPFKVEEGNNKNAATTIEYFFTPSYRLKSLDGKKTVEFYIIPVNSQRNPAVWYKPMIHSITDHKDDRKYQIEKIDENISLKYLNHQQQI